MDAWQVDLKSIRSNEELSACMSDGKRVKFLFFWGHTVPKDGSVRQTCFSQWYPADFEIDGIKYATAEHFMMAAKARLFGDQEALERILEAKHPRQAKRLGRGVVGFEESQWNQERFAIVVAGNLEKFRQNTEMRDFLLNTGSRVLVEASPADRIWGIGMAKDHPDVESPENWRGLNLLGYALMEVRARLEKEGL